ncbi:unnamed protein product, partial [Phaeothamnion confervicola]
MRVSTAAADCPFDVIAVTAPNERAALAFLDELAFRFGVDEGSSFKRKANHLEVVLFVIADPAGARIGSGGGTLNALDFMSHAFTPLSSGLARRRTLLVHSGGDSQRSPTQCVCGKAWAALNS